MKDTYDNDLFWQNVINSIPDPVFVKDRDHRWIAFNDAFCTFMGYAREAIEGKSDFDFFPKEEAEEFWSVDDMVFSNGEEIENEELLTDSTGKTHIIATKKALVQTPSGEKFLVGIIRDVSARKRAQSDLEKINSTLEKQATQRTLELEQRANRLIHSEKELRQQSKLLESILNRLNDAVLVVDSKGRCLHTNPAVHRIIGIPPEEDSFWIWLAERVRPEARPLVMRAASQKSSDIDEIEFFEQSTSHVRWLSISSRRLSDNETIDERNVIVVNDFTARHRALAELRESENRLLESQKMQALGRLAGGIAHDFSNVLQIIQITTGVIEDELPPGSPIHSDLNQIKNAVQRATTLSRQLLTFGRRGHVTPQLLNLAKIIRESEDMLHRVIGANYKLQFDAPEKLPLTFIDRAHFEQILMNLIINARESMTNGGNIEVKLEESYNNSDKKPQVVLSVSDRGHGMDQSTQSRVFEPFFTTKGHGGGTGLGLATVYTIVNQYGGNITVESEADVGSVFRVFLPASPGSTQDSVRPKEPYAPSITSE